MSRKRMHCERLTLYTQLAITCMKIKHSLITEYYKVPFDLPNDSLGTPLEMGTMMLMAYVWLEAFVSLDLLQVNDSERSDGSLGATIVLCIVDASKPITIIICQSFRAFELRSHLEPGLRV